MPLRQTDKLIFVYNADSGLFNLLADMAHKFLKPETYDCQLCMLTHGHFGMRDQWHEYLESFGTELVFLHRDEFRKQYPDHKAELPTLLLSRGDATEIMVSASTINSCSTLDTLIQRVNERLKTIPD